MRTYPLSLLSNYPNLFQANMPNSIPLALIPCATVAEARQLVRQHSGHAAKAGTRKRYRMLKENEKVSRRDQFKSSSGWVTATLWGWTVTGLEVGRYRRPLHRNDK